MKQYKLKYNNIAIIDLDNVYNGVLEASRDDEIARKYVRDLLDAIEDKTYFPLSTPTFDFCGLMIDVHHFTFKAYKIFYRVQNDEIEVFRILPAKMNYIEKLKL